MLEPSRVASLTALSVPQPEAFMRSWFTSRQGLKSWYMAAFNVPRLPERLARDEGGFMERLLGGGFGMTPDEVARFRREIVEDGALPGGLGWYRGIPFMDRSLLGRRVTVPTTLVWSDGDAAICRAPVDATPRYVDAPYELVVLQGVTHWIPTQAPEAAAEAILERVLGS
jgi:pimeloyl-ACP methyl ester carboxylesterase